MSNFNIFDIDTWTTATAYSKYKIVTINNLYYYANSSHTSGATFATDNANGLWGGITTDNGETKPIFIWKPSYDYSNDNEPRVKTVQFGDGYEQTLQDGINNLLMAPTYTFENVDLDELTAILHFLYARAGAESFMFVPPAPYGKLKRFRCKQWNHTQKFYNNYTIQAKFNEVVV